jgi:SAM-dependent methyltransferase
MSILLKTFKWIGVLSLFFIGKCRGLFVPGKFGIRKGYRYRKKEIHWDDTPYKDEYQKEVYELARIYLDRYGYKEVLDVGCGSGFKLLQYFSDCNTIGMEVSTTYDFLRQQYPNRNWINVTHPEQLPSRTDIIICADVIEHVTNPDGLLKMIDKIDFEYLFLSTPERIMARGWYDFGPPQNVCHIREWSAKEFKQYVEGFFTVISHQITHVEDATQLLICRKKAR